MTTDTASGMIHPDPRLTHPESTQAYIDYPLPAGDHDTLRQRAQAERQRDPRPNILWIFTDQQLWNAMSCAGNPHVFTPNMDRLAQRGTRFANCYCASPVCGPSRASLVTGRMPHEVGVHVNGQTPDPAVPSMGEIFRQAGYETYWSGKWHLPESYVRSGTEMRGFRNVRLPGGLKANGLGAAIDMAYAGDASYLLQYHLNLQSKPWLYTVSLHNPHDICFFPSRDFPRRDGSRWQNVDHLPPLPANHGIPANEPEMIAAKRRGEPYNITPTHCVDWSEADWRAYIKAYYSMVEEVDRCLGQILNALDAGGMADNTVIAFTSDHGEGAGAHQWASKVTLYEEAIRVPLILSTPGGKRDQTDEQSLTSTLDLFPTFCDYAGIDGPAELRGTSLRASMEGKGPAAREAVFAHLATAPSNLHRQARMVRSSRFKYNTYSEGANPEELFDLEQDPGEMRNLATDPAYQSEKQGHRALLREWLRQTADPFELV